MHCLARSPLLHHKRHLKEAGREILRHDTSGARDVTNVDTLDSRQHRAAHQSTDIGTPTEQTRSCIANRVNGQDVQIATVGASVPMSVKRDQWRH